MDEILKFVSINSAPKTNLKKCLLSLKIRLLKNLAYYFGILPDDMYSKTELVEKLIPHLVKSFKNCIEYFSSNELEFLYSINNENLQAMDDLEYQQYRLPVCFHYVFLFNHKGHIYPVIPDELKEMIPKKFSGKFKERVLFNQKLFSYARALTNLYGMYNVEQLIKVWNYHNSDKITSREVKKFMRNSGLWKIYFDCYIDVIFSTYFYDSSAEETFDFFAKADNIEYYMPTQKDIEYFSENDADNRSIYYKKIENFLKERLPNSEKIRNNILDQILFECVTFGDPSEILDMIGDAGIIFTGIDEANAFLQLFMDLSKNTRKWKLRGHTQVEFYKKENSQIYNTFLKSPADSKIKVKIGRNDPCSCGSGKKYKKCCGKSEFIGSNTI